MAYLNLAQLLDLKTSDDFVIKKPEIAFARSPLLDMSAEQIFSFALNRQPEIRGAELRLASAHKGLKISRGTASPNLTLTGSYGTGFSGASMQVDDVFLKGFVPTGFTGSGDTVFAPDYGYDYSVKSFKDQIDDNSNYTLGLQLSVPIFNAWQSRTSIARAKIAINQSELNLQQTKSTLYKTIQQALADAGAAYNRYLAGEKSVSALAESFAYTEQRFNVGLVNSVEYNDAKTRLNIARSNVLQAKYEYVFRIKVLEFYMGNPLSMN
jgi:outer membrane protein